MPGRTQRVPGALLKKAIIGRARRHWHHKFPPNKQAAARTRSAFVTTYLALEGHVMLTLLLITCINTFSHVYSSHRHEEVSRIAAEKAWYRLQCQSTKRGLAAVQEALRLHDRRTDRPCDGLTFVRELYHKEILQQLQVGSQHREQYKCWHESWQRIQTYSKYQTQIHQKQQHAATLQLASQKFHLQYWNMQHTRHLVGSLMFTIGLQQITFKVWSPQTSSGMPRSDPV
ncbi:hypothetical protein WJX79_004512 [Trebouxia sp. C0005]